MRRIWILSVLLLLSSIGFSAETLQKVNRIDPPCWWTGFENRQLQLKIYGDNISLLTPVIAQPGISVISITRAQSPNYLFVDLTIDETAKPGKFIINFMNDKKVVQKVEYELKTRESGSAMRKSFTSSDVIYLLFPDRFANGDPTNDNIKGYPDTLNRDNLHGRHGGDIRGIINHLDYLNELGITAIWNTPLLEDNLPNGSYHHYATTDYYNVDPRFGNNNDYKLLADECHKRNIKLIMDLVPNHCGSEHPWMKDLPFADWTHGGNTYTQTNYRIATTNDPYVSERDFDLNFNGWFVSEMPDLNQNNPFLLTYLKQFAIWWIEFVGLDGIRVDTYPYNDPAKAAEWTNAIRREYPNLNLVGECWQHRPSEVAYWQSGTKNGNGYDSGLPSVMDFVLTDAISVAFNEDNQGWDRGVGQLWSALTMDYLYADPNNLVTFADNHDINRFATTVGNDIRKYKLAFAFLLTTRGIPQIYYGSELMMGGDKGKGDGDIRRDMPGGWPGDERNVFSKQGRTDIENEVFDFMKTLLNWRKTNEVIHSGKLLHFIPEDNLYVYFRYNSEKKVMIILNNKNEAKKVNAQRFNQMTKGSSSGVDVISGRTFDINAPFEIGAKTALILELK